MTFLRDGIDSYSSAKSSSTATPSLLFGRSRMWPIDATTLKSRPRYLLMVFAFAGDSTTTNAFAIEFLVPNPCRIPVESQIPNPESRTRALLLTLARSVKPHEPPAAESPNQFLHFEL